MSKGKYMSNIENQMINEWAKDQTAEAWKAARSLEVQLFEALHNHYLSVNYSPNPVKVMLKAADTLIKVVDDQAENCALCDTSMLSERVEDNLSLCHACYCTLMEAN